MTIAPAAKSPEEQRQEVEKQDATKDVHFNLAVFIAVLATASSGAAVLAVLAAGFLGRFRQDVEYVWLACLPLCFSFITGIALAYRKHLADVGVHVALAITTLLAGGAGYTLSVTPVYLQRHNCTQPPHQDEDCSKDVLTAIYFFAGAVASGLAALGLLVSLCACSNAMNRRAKKERIKMLILEYEEEKKLREENKRRLAQTNVLPVASPGKTNGAVHVPPRSNGAAIPPALLDTSDTPAKPREVERKPPETPASESAVGEVPQRNGEIRTELEQETSCADQVSCEGNEEGESDASPRDDKNMSNHRESETNAKVMTHL